MLKQVRIDEAEQHRNALKEIEAHRRFDHPNLMPLLDCTTTSKSVAWMVFPLCSRGSLRVLIDAKSLRGTDAWSPLEFSRLFEGTCKGVAAIHAKGMAHRDIKPENVLLNHDGRPILMDFGSMAPSHVCVLTRRDALVLQDEAAVNSTMTYRAPELWQPEVPSEIDTAKSDVWALGCLLWAMAYGYSPFESDFPSGAKRPRIVECTHLRVLVQPQPPPKDAFATRHEPDFFFKVCDSAMHLLVTDYKLRPDVDRALQIATALRSGDVEG